MNVSWTTYSSEQSLFGSPVEGHPQATRERMGRKWAELAFRFS